MSQKQWKSAAGVLALAVSVVAVGVPFDTAAAASVPTHVKETSWGHAMKQVPEIRRVLHQRHVIALADAKTSLQANVRIATTLFESSKGKASDDSRQKLAVERNRASAMVMVSDDEVATDSQQAPLQAAVVTVTDEVTAWEVAEAARIAEEARLAEEARVAAVAASQSRGQKKSGGAAAAEAAGQSPQQYLEGLAAAYGASISWTGTPCGRAASGCYQGGSTLYVSTSLYSSWDRAKGRGRNVVLHEASHMIIQNKCGTVLLGGARFENVTDAYTVLLGGGQTGYGYNDNDMALASAALGGQCLAG